MRERLTNWAGNITFGARRLHRPESVAELRAVLAGADRLRVLGSGHSFNRLADTDGDLVSLAGLPRTVEIAPDRRSVRIDGGIRYGELAARLAAEGLALHNMASLPHISVAGAVATATHGSGVRHGNLATAVSGLEILRADGSTAVLDRDHPDLAGAVVGLGALGVVTALTLDVVPAFELRQYVYENLPAAALDEHLDEILSAGYSVSLFTRWTGPDIDQVWLKRDAPLTGDLFGARPADGPRHPVPGMPAENCTGQGGVPGPWHERLPHFRMEFTPSSGEELQSEWHVPRTAGRAAIAAVAGLRERVAAVLQVCEIRTIAADGLWLSPNHEQDSLALHFTWIADTDAVLPVVADLEKALAPHGARPHWGKIFTTAPSDVRGAYPRFGDFAALAHRFDPQGMFRNAWLDSLLDCSASLRGETPGDR
ncbi:xylitol oxidase [Actinoplanes campanulatus]|uniref:Xylitol oxidase n=1 Tax=Actinoplanes campanulatus TaxID=113559 RepID=A0A7W5AMA8_9ACTN|nr:D-arabinono-1,4-lactone oxidase [Actinoplanes campanulatus]MBB3098745.1 xylitol oxidase [Actinoplanes campanulatus]GGN37232.1 putative xylitol oxidase [Actinoplanes campanulatus]GID40752.1 putative xylitol oxidase [Actinoplanes campanulatus]